MPADYSYIGCTGFARKNQFRQGMALPSLLDERFSDVVHTDHQSSGQISGSNPGGLKWGLRPSFPDQLPVEPMLQLCRVHTGSPAVQHVAQRWFDSDLLK